MTLDDIFENGPMIQGDVLLSLFDGEKKVDERLFPRTENLMLENRMFYSPVRGWKKYEVTYIFVGADGWLHIELQKEAEA